jgi:hypothetical protein
MEGCVAERMGEENAFRRNESERLGCHFDALLLESSQYFSGMSLDRSMESSGSFQ